jgi:peptidoglycan hydrolase-like protein with peptidoglycan-binding domain
LTIGVDNCQTITKYLYFAERLHTNYILGGISLKKVLASVTCAMVAVSSLSVAADSSKLGLLGADVVSAATGETTTTTTSKPTTTTTKKPTATTTKTTTKVSTTTQTSSTISRLLAFGSNGSDVKVLQTSLNNKGYKLNVDGIFGKQTLNAVKNFQSKNGLKADGIVGARTLAKLNPVVTAPAATPVAKKVSVKLGKAEYAAHGTKCFTVAVVAMAGDKIVDAYIDDYQIGAGNVGVPNSDKDFGKGFTAGSALYSKKLNADAYSKNMKEKGGATLSVQENFGAVEKFAVGKTIAQLEAAIKANPADPKIDAVTGATLTDTNGYLAAIVEAAKAANASKGTEVEATLANSVKVGKVDYAAHGTKCFTLATTAVAGDKIVAAIIDDYQIGAGNVGVPNSDKDFGKGIVTAGSVLYSKKLNADAYSKNMKEKGGATLTVQENFGAVEQFAVGKTIAQLEAAIKANPADPKVDAVAGATLTDTNGYLNAILASAKTAVGVAQKVTVKLGKVEYAAHGTKCFTVAVVAMSGDKIANAYIDDYQIGAGNVGVPNSDKDFGKGFTAGSALYSKKLNADAYSKNMKEKGGATLSVQENFGAVEKFAVGKTIAQLEAAIKENSTDPKVDAVTGATLADTNGYLTAILEAAKVANASKGIEIDAAVAHSIKVGKVDYAAHGTKCFTLATTAVVGDKIVAAIIDDYQIGAGNVGVPNSDKDFGKGIVTAGSVLYSKKLNADAYSKNMKEKGGATLTVQANFGAVEQFAVGKTISQLDAEIKANPADPKVDAVTGATLADTNGYLNAILESAKVAK